MGSAKTTYSLQNNVYLNNQVYNMCKLLQINRYKYFNKKIVDTNLSLKLL